MEWIRNIKIEKTIKVKNGFAYWVATNSGKVVTWMRFDGKNYFESGRAEKPSLPIELKNKRTLPDFQNYEDLTAELIMITNDVKVALKFS